MTSANKQTALPPLLCECSGCHLRRYLRPQDVATTHWTEREVRPDRFALTPCGYWTRSKEEML